MPSRPTTAAVITPPRHTTSLIALFAAWALAASIVALSAYILFRSANSGGGHLGAALALLCAPLCALAVAAMVTRARLEFASGRRRARALLESTEAGRDRPPAAALAEAIAFMERCRANAPHHLRRNTLDRWESRLPYPLPRLWIAGPGALAQLVCLMKISAPYGPADQPILIPARLRSIYLYEIVLSCLIAAFIIVVLFGSLSAHGALGTAMKVVACPAGAVLYCAARNAFRSGWWLQLHDRRMRLIRLSRRGRERIAYDIDPADTFAVIWYTADHVTLAGMPPGAVGWRILPPHPIPTFEVYDIDPRLTPWADPITDACTAADSRA